MGAHAECSSGRGTNLESYKLCEICTYSVTCERKVSILRVQGVKQCKYVKYLLLSVRPSLGPN